MIVEARGLTRRFGDLVAVDTVDLSVAPGEIVGLIGANGAGKTTLIRMLLGLLRPSAGEVTVFGTPPSIMSRRRTGYVPQGLGLWEDLTVAENLEFSGRAFRNRIPDLDPGLRPHARTLVRDLPLGLRRKAAFAAALNHRPDLLVLDEPTSGVGPLGRTSLWDAIRSAAEAGAGVVASTHHMSEAEQCDRVVVMAGGRTVAEGTMASIVGDAEVVDVRAESWRDAFNALESAGLRCGLVGRCLRVTGTGAGVVRATLDGAGIDAIVSVAPATFEEAFVVLATAGSA